MNILEIQKLILYFKKQSICESNHLVSCIYHIPFSYEETSLHVKISHLLRVSSYN